MKRLKNRIAIFTKNGGPHTKPHIAARLLTGIVLSAAFWMIPYQATAQSSFRFIAWGDTKNATSVLSSLSNQAKNMGANFTLYGGDLCDSGFTQSCMDNWKRAMDGDSNNGMFDKTFSVRGNHDSSNASGWQSYYNFRATATAVGARNYAELSEDLTYSFDFGNSHFIGVDILGDVTKMSSGQISWIDSDLTAAENRGLTHAFLFWHGPIYALAEHCCPTAPAELVTVLNKHSIVSATFHGHEHVYAYTHIDSSRIPNVTHEFEEIVAGDAGAGPDTAISGRYDYWMNAHGFVTVDVSGDIFTVSFYKQGTASPQKTFTFTKNSPPLADRIPPAHPTGLRIGG